MMEVIEQVSDLVAPAILIHGSHDLYTANEMYELDNQGIDLDTIDLTSDYWYLFIANLGEEYGYVISLNQKNYTQDDILNVGKSIQLQK